MRRKTFSILFMIRRGQLLRNHEAPIYKRITIDGVRAEISIKRSIDPAYWNEVKGCSNTGSPFPKELNNRLDQIRYQVYRHQKELIDSCGA
jgi:hypothetical protein